MKLVPLMEGIIHEVVEKNTLKVKGILSTNKNYIYYKSKNSSLVSQQRKYGDSFSHSISKCIHHQGHVLY